MAFLTTNLIQRILSKLGQVEPVFGLFEATGGSATTFVNSNFANYDNPVEQDAIKNYLAIVVRDSAGAGASPEGKWSIVSAYNDATWTGTIATVTDAIASGDTIMLAKQDKFPIQQIIFAINTALEELGDLPNNADVSLTTGASQTEYNIPVAVKRGLKQVWVQGRTNDSNDNQWFLISDRRNELTGAGTASILYMPQMPSGRTIRLIYDGAHPVVSAYDSVINEYIHPQLITCKAIINLLEWYNRRDENQEVDSYLLWLEEQYRMKYLPEAEVKHPIKEEFIQPNFFSKGKRQSVDSPPSPFL